MKRKNASEISAHNFENYLRALGNLEIGKVTNASNRELRIEKYGSVETLT